MSAEIEAAIFDLLGKVAPGKSVSPEEVARVAGSYLTVAVVVLGGVALSAAGERRWTVSIGVLAGLVAITAVADIAPRGHVVGHLRVAVVQGGGPQHTRSADTDNWVVFQREVRATKTIKGPVDLVLWPEDVVALVPSGAPDDAVRWFGQALTLVEQQTRPDDALRAVRAAGNRSLDSPGGKVEASPQFRLRNEPLNCRGQVFTGNGRDLHVKVGADAVFGFRAHLYGTRRGGG